MEGARCLLELEDVGLPSRHGGGDVSMDEIITSEGTLAATGFYP